MVRANGSEYTRVLAGNTVLVPWYLSSSPLGTAFFVPGLWMFDINEEGRLVLYYHDGDTPPDFMIDDDGHLLMEIA
jgi:hypothetical protein